MSDNHKKIHLDLSFIHFIGPKENSWRTNIKSVLKSKNDSFYLVKECRSQFVGPNPFDHPDRYEFLCIVDNDSTNIIRTSPISDATTNLKKSAKLEYKKHFIEEKIEYLSFKKVNEIVSSNQKLNVYCEIEYEYEKKNFNLITKCEFINYNSYDNNKYLQPIMGYVPFILNNHIKYGYAVLFVNENKRSNLEFLLNEKTPVFTIKKNENFISKVTKNILNHLLFFSKKNNFTKLISIRNSKIKFFKYS